MWCWGVRTGNLLVLCAWRVPFPIALCSDLFSVSWWHLERNDHGGR